MSQVSNRRARRLSSNEMQKLVHEAYAVHYVLLNLGFLPDDGKCAGCGRFVCRHCTLTVPGSMPVRFRQESLCSRQCPGKDWFSVGGRGRDMDEVKDAYGVVVDPNVPRHDKCSCDVPCQKRFRCRSRHHPGDRKTPYCLGGEGQSCNDCWWKERNRTGSPAIAEVIAVEDRA